MITELHRLLALQRRPGLENRVDPLPLGIPAIDEVLGGGFLRGALHEIAARGESHIAAAAGFALGLAGHAGNRRSVFWIAGEMALAESGAPHGAGLDAIGLAPERLVMVSVAHRRDLLWTMEEALRSRAVCVVIGEMRGGRIDEVAVRRLSLSAADSGALGLLLRVTPPADASTAAPCWLVGAALSVTSQCPGASRFVVHLARNRYGTLGSWILEWSDRDERFILPTHAQPVAAPALNRSHRQVA